MLRPPEAAPRPRGSELAWAAAAPCLLALPFLGKAYHIDDTLFLAMARQVLRDFWHPTDFPFNWHGSAAPLSSISTNPPLMAYLLAPLWALSGGREWLMRLMALPLDALAGASLYVVAARFLRRPLLPTLIVLACPAYSLSMQLLSAERGMAAFAFAGLAALALARGRRERGWFWASAALLSAATLFKYAAVALAVPATVLAASGGASRARLAAYWAVILAPVGLYLLWGAGSSAPAAPVAAYAWLHAPRDWASFLHRLRALLAFLGGGSVAAAAWPWLGPRPARRRAWAAAAFAVVLFLPVFDLEPASWGDRALGALLAAGAALALADLLSARTERFFLSWALSIAALQLFVFWSVAARFVLWMIPPVVFASARALEERSGPRAAAALRWTLGAALCLSLCLSYVDLRYAGAQREAARFVAGRYLPGRRIWFTGHWGLQFYMESIGASALDRERGGWDEVRPGDVVVVPGRNSFILKPRRPVRADMRTLSFDCLVPLRLIPADSTRAGFYTSEGGFLPFAFSSAPLTGFAVLEVL